MEWSNFSQPMYYTIVANQIDIKGWCRHIAVRPCQCISFNSFRNQPVLVSSHCAALPLYKFQFVAEYVVWFISECGYTDDSHSARSIHCVCAAPPGLLSPSFTTVHNCPTQTLFGGFVEPFLLCMKRGSGKHEHHTIVHDGLCLWSALLKVWSYSQFIWTCFTASLERV